jgi:hypothetical protein
MFPRSLRGGQLPETKPELLCLGEFTLGSIATSTDNPSLPKRENYYGNMRCGVCFCGKLGIYRKNQTTSNLV